MQLLIQRGLFSLNMNSPLYLKLKTDGGVIQNMGTVVFYPFLLSKTVLLIAFKLINNKRVDHFTVVGLVNWPLYGSEAKVDLVLIQRSLLLLCKSSCSFAN